MYNREFAAERIDRLRENESYAIPTMQGGPETIRPYVDDFVEFARILNGMSLSQTNRE
jgi:hypothetical protein